MQPENKKPEEQNDSKITRFESDTQKVVRQHLEDEDHEISEEDIKNVRIGMTPPMDEPTRVGVEELQEKIDENNQQHKTGGDKPVTPWDVVDPGA